MIPYFEQNKDLLQHESLREKLKYVIFNFTKQLLVDIENGEYDKIVKHYFESTNY